MPKPPEDRSAKNETMDLLKNAIFSAPKVEKEKIEQAPIPEVKHFSKIAEKVESVMQEIKKENEEQRPIQNIPNNINTYGNIKVESKEDVGPLHVFDLPNLKNPPEEIAKKPEAEEKIKASPVSDEQPREIPEDVLKQVLNKE